MSVSNITGRLRYNVSPHVTPRLYAAMMAVPPSDLQAWILHKLALQVENEDLLAAFRSATGAALALRPIANLAETIGGGAPATAIQIQQPTDLSKASPGISTSSASENPASGSSKDVTGLTKRTQDTPEAPVALAVHNASLMKAMGGTADALTMANELL